MKKMIANGPALVVMGLAWMPWTGILIRNLTSPIPFVQTIQISLPSHES